MVSIVDRTRAFAFSHLGPRRSHSVSHAETRPLQSVPKPIESALRSGSYGSVRILRMGSRTRNVSSESTLACMRSPTRSSAVRK
jgi:hypothetical protein